MKLSPALSWHGGKSRLAAKIIALFPEHQTYCEPFGGSDAVLLAKEPSPVEVFNDLDDSLITLFRVLRDPDLCDQLQKACQGTLYSRSEFELTQEPTDNPVERARRFLVRQRMSRSGLGERWTYSVEDSRRDMASVVRRWQAAIERLPGLHQRLRTVQIEHADWREILDRYDGDGTLFYVDPPYLQDTGSVAATPTRWRRAIILSWWNDCSSSREWSFCLVISTHPTNRLKREDGEGGLTMWPHTAVIPAPEESNNSGSRQPS
jgi:DNA adenine methylase